MGVGGAAEGSEMPSGLTARPAALPWSARRESDQTHHANRYLHGVAFATSFFLWALKLTGHCAIAPRTA